MNASHQTSSVHSLLPFFVKQFGEENVFVDEPMSRHTSFKIGGPADVLVMPTCTRDVQLVVQRCKEANVSWRILGLGSNVLVSDEGLRGATIKLARTFNKIDVKGNRICAQAGATNASVAAAALRAGLCGYEFAAGIPGTVGGAAIMNAGAYGGEFAHVCESVYCLTSMGNFETISAKDAQWAYRHSAMMENGSVVLEATIKLTPDDPTAIQRRMNDLRRRREEKQPLSMPSAGSAFKRPEGHFAAKLIEEAGLRGYSCGGAQISEKHCGFIVNTGGATANDVRTLIVHVQDVVYTQTGIHLEPEIRMWGF